MTFSGCSLDFLRRLVGNGPQHCMQDYMYEEVLRTSVGDVLGTSVRGVPCRYIQGHMGTSSGRRQETSTGRWQGMSLSVPYRTKYGRPLDVTFSRPQDISRGRPRDVGRRRLLALHIGPNEDVHSTYFGDVLRMSSRFNFVEWEVH